MLDKVTRGQKFQPSAAERNAVVDLLREWRSRQQPQSLDTLEIPTASATLVHIQNTTGDALTKGRVLGFEKVLGQPGSPEFIHTTLLKGRVPIINDLYRFVVLVDDVSPGMVGRAIVDGLVVVRVDVSNDEHGFAIAKLSETSALQSAHDGPAEILWREEGIGLRWAIVRLSRNIVQVPELVRFELTEKLALKGTAQGKRLRWDGDTSQWLVTGEPITIRDPFPFPGRWQGYSGYRGYGTPSGGTDPFAPDQLDVVEMDTIARSMRVTLTTPLTPGGGGQVDDTRPVGGTNASAKATVTGWFLQGRDPTVALPETGQTITVHDPQGMFPWAVASAKALARWNDRDERYELVQCQQVSPFLACNLAKSCCPQDLYAECESFGATCHSPFSQKPTGNPTVLNYYGLAGKSGMPALIAWDQTITEWVLFQVQHRPAALVFDARMRIQVVNSPGGDGWNQSSSSSSGSGGGCNCPQYLPSLEVRRVVVSVMSCQEPGQIGWESVPSYQQG